MRAVEEGQFDWGDSDYNTHVEEMFKMYVQPFLQSNTPARRVQSLSQLQQTIKYRHKVAKGAIRTSERLGRRDQLGSFITHVMADSKMVEGIKEHREHVILT
ncbi:Hypp1109 [Branchiostoma lanceolatum]|uniref:Hypp1109 protein n=1 Tax=Branchiostoma lanceolatum TaxID=7740 RepID=A0A8J9ZGG1_BRALA|nr:Hypp1109 [Branchiostoma lanceolatum]